MSAGGTGTSKDQLATQNKLQADAIAQQKALRDQIMGSIGKYLSGPGEGFDPQQLAIMQSQFLNQNSANFNQAGSSVLASLRSRGVAGGDSAAGGDLTRSLEALQGARASSQSQGILGTNLANLQAALNNKFNAASVASGQSAQIGTDIGTFGQGASNALSNYVTASNSGFLSKLATGLGSGIGQAAVGFATGGISTALGGIGKSGNCVMVGTEIIPLDSDKEDQSLTKEEFPETEWVHLETAGGMTLDCTHDHPLFTSESGKVTAASLKVGDTMITRTGEDVISVLSTFTQDAIKIKTEMKYGHLFWANGFLSHNYKSKNG